MKKKTYIVPLIGTYQLLSGNILWGGSDKPEPGVAPKKPTEKKA